MSMPATESRAEMGITHSDFLRIFPRLVGDAQSSEIGLDTCVEWSDGRRVMITLSQEFVRKIALLRLPYVNINFEFQGFTSEQQAAFMRQFDRSFHKGGG